MNRPNVKTEDTSARPHSDRRRSRLRSVATQRLIYLGLGWPILLIGLLTAPTPLPIGIPLVIVGLFFLARGSHWVRDRIIRLREAWPELSGKLNGLKPSMPRPVRQFLHRTDPVLFARRRRQKNLNKAEQK